MRSFKKRCRCCRPQQRMAVAEPELPQASRNTRLIDLARQVSVPRLRSTVEELVGTFPTRHTLSPHIGDVAQWLEGRFRTLGYRDVHRLPVVRSIPQRGRRMRFFNVLCRKPGRNDAPVRIVCAHFDSRTKRSFDSDSPAPGANDNATGIAVMLELAALLKEVDLPDTVAFLGTSGEEQGLWGSTDFAAKLRKTDAHVRFLLNLDEVGFPNDAREIRVEYDRMKPNSNNKESKRISGEVAAVAFHHLGIRTKRALINNSDYMPFEHRGYVTFGLFESGHYDKFRHSRKDIIGEVKFDYVADVARVALTALLLDFEPPDWVDQLVRAYAGAWMDG